MEHNDPTAAIILGEIALILFLILAGLLTTLALKKRKKAKQLATILDELEATQEERTQTLLKDMGMASSIAHEQLKPIAEAIATEESTIKKAMITAYIKSDTTVLDEFDGEMKKLSDYYLNVLQQNGAASSGTEETAEEEPLIPDMDDAVDDLLASEGDEVEADAEFDLSETDDLPDMEAEEIAEIPDDLINTN